MNQGAQTASKRTAHGTEVQHSLLSQGPLRGNASRACMAHIRAATQVPGPCFFVGSLVHLHLGPLNLEVDHDYNKLRRFATKV